MYTPMGWIPAESIASSTTGYSHSQHAPRFAVMPVIPRAALWWNAVRTLIVSLVTTQLSLTYSNTDCTITLYISPLARTVAPALYRTLAITPHRLRDFYRLRQTYVKSMLLYVIVCPNYGNVSNSGKLSALIWNKTLLASKHRCRVSRLRHIYSPCLHLSDM